MKLKKADYTKTDKQIIKEMIGIIRYYRVNLNRYMPYNQYKIKKHIEVLKDDLRLELRLYNFKKRNKS